MSQVIVVGGGAAGMMAAYACAASGHQVVLLEKNEKYAAVEGISPEQEIVTEASRTLEDGSRVKMKNET